MMENNHPKQDENIPSGKGKLTYSRFESEMQARPDDIDMNQHVHASKYFDYVLAARYDQMERCYGMSMEKFADQGLGWFVANAYIEYKRALKMGESFLVRTWIEEILKQSVRVGFEILKKKTGKVSADGFCTYTLVNMETGRAEKISAEIIKMYSV
ncbi:MAG: acyl-CoA thioesterase [Verrucomicrobiales bacterium]